MINATLAGVIREAQASGAFGSILGARRAVEGILSDDYIGLTDLPTERLDRLSRTPSAALGTSRHRPTDTEVQQVLDAFRRRDVTVFVSIGGNDTADTASRLTAGAESRGQELRVVMAPKTIDNDLPETDHCPGYGSIARFVALAVRDAAFDTRAMAHIYPVKIVEVMGRNAGWLTAAGSLALAPDARLPRPILCLPERRVAGIDELVSLVRSRIDADGYAVLVAPETMKWADGSAVSGDTPDWIDAFGHRYYPGVGNALARQIGAALDIKARYDKPGTIARMAMHAASDVDLAEAELVGSEAVRRALAGETGVMVAIVRESDDPYRVSYRTVPLDRIANTERLLPDEMIAASGHDVTDAFARYALPLIGPAIALYEVLD